MFFERYGIRLQKLEVQHLETVRQWRNQDFVRLHMHYQELISPEAQSAWFANLHPQNNWYFLASFQQEPFGLFHIKNINWRKCCGEAGAFVSTPQFVGQPEAAFAILALMDFGFFILELQTLEAKYNPAIKEIEALNRQLGYEVYQEETGGFVRAAVTKNRYLERAGFLRVAAGKLQGIQTGLSMNAVG